SESFDHDRVDEYIEKGEAAEGYLESEAILKRLMDSSDNVEFCYVYRILEDGCHVVFDPDTDDTPGGAPGEVVDFDAAFMKDLPTLLAGGRIDPIISNETYGWLLTIYEPVYDSHGVCQCYAAVDINMTHIANNAYQFLARVLSLFFGFFVLILSAAIWLAEYNVILPINTMSMTTDQFAFDSASARAGTLEKIKGLNILTGDEIENLYKAVVKTTGDMVEYIAQMQHQNEQINKLQNGLIMVLADMVESRDQCTGDHVRKTAAYTGIIMRQLKRDGIYTDQLTDEFMKDVENSAPLHDVGKIQVPDAILNKPGKLTDEEFALMKQHTSAGSEIISRAIDTVSEEDSSYLEEARNLAHYHHEKWNGMGYPDGLKGEEIPLSARVMAVADVFDALVSKRPYKDGFPFEKAMAIIRESSGSHFDPNVVNAFVEASDEVRQVMNTYMGN
ncbi:MAG: HD domain-containing protein, partial [Clostridia bacterium]|nr:HD domain-containing protein [Clostridia bacterium]